MVPEDQAGLLSPSQGWSWVGGGCCQEGRGPLFLARHLLGGRGPAAGPGHLTSIPPHPGLSQRSELCGDEHDHHGVSAAV